MSVAYVQSKLYSSGVGTSATATIAFTSAPIAGNMLYVGMSYATGQAPSTPPAGWTTIDRRLIAGTAGMTIYSHKVVQGETNSYAFTMGGADFLSAVGIEVSGQNLTARLNQEGSSQATGVTSLATPALTPSDPNCLALAFWMANDGNTTSATAPTITAGWTVDQNPRPDFHAMASAHMNSLTTDTQTAIQPTWTWVSTDMIAVLLLVGPPATKIVPKNSVRPRPFAPGMAR